MISFAPGPLFYRQDILGYLIAGTLGLVAIGVLVHVTIIIVT